MFNKLTFIVTISILVISIPLNKLIAQQEKSVIGDLLINHSRLQTPKTFTKNTETSTQTRDHRRSRYRSIDGTGNNSRNFEWGSVNSIFRRVLPAAYAAGTSGDLGGENRPSAREISNLVCDEPVTIFTERFLSTTGYQWGQFLDHDITLTPNGDESAPIPLPEEGEETFTVDIPFTRSLHEVINNQREQVNFNTAYIDGSGVYGSDKERALWLRTMSDGKLKNSEGNFLPYNTIDGEITGEIDPNAPVMDGDGEGTIRTFVAGDIRASENPVLLSIQTIFMREHNRICDDLRRRGLRNDEQIYQIARKRVGALIQSITYNEFLPSLGVQLSRYRGYRRNVQPDILNTFASASYRIGHTLVSDDVVIVDDNCEELGPGEFDLIETFFNPTLFKEYPIEAWLKGSTVHELYETNTKINDVLRNFLFGDPSSPVRFGIDLASINIQRGRDHGLPDYNTLRAHYTGDRAENFADISSTDSVATSLQILYNDIDNIDAWVGLLSEDLLENKSVGSTMNAMMKEQFENLRNGDFYYFENDPFLSRSAKRIIKRTTLADVIKRNTTLNNSSLPKNVFFLDPCLPEEENKIVSDNKNLVPEFTYSNPVFNTLSINYTDALSKNNKVIEIYSLNGTLVKKVLIEASQNQIQINTENLAKGIYLVKTNSNSNDQNIKVFKIVKM